jgi:hypothetical protein
LEWRKEKKRRGVGWVGVGDKGKGEDSQQSSDPVVGLGWSGEGTRERRKRLSLGCDLRQIIGHL